MPCRIWSLTIYKFVDPEGYYDFLELYRKENKSALKNKETQEFEILEKFKKKADTQDEVLYKEGTLHSSIINRHKAVDLKRKKKQQEHGNPDAESEDDSVFLPDDLSEKELDQNDERYNSLNDK